MYVCLYVRGLVEYSVFICPTRIYWAVIMCQVTVLSIVYTLINKNQPPTPPRKNQRKRRRGTTTRKQIQFPLLGMPSLSSHFESAKY